MNQNVKEFIEQNIDLIEEHNWNSLFDKWYTKYHMFDHSVDNLQLSELFYILQEIGIIPDEHLAARKELIIKYFNEYIDDSIFEHKKMVTPGGAITSLHSWLGFSLFALRAHFVDICKQRGFKEDIESTRVGRFILP